MKALYFNQVTNYIYQCFKTDSKVVFEVKHLEQMYANLLDHNNIPYVRLFSRFTYKLLSAVPEILKRYVKHQVTLFFHVTLMNVYQTIYLPPPNCLFILWTESLSQYERQWSKLKILLTVILTRIVRKNRFQ